MFETEATGLEWLAEANAIRTPRVIAWSNEPPSFLALEWLDPSPRTPNFDEELGRRLASLHAFGAPAFGLDHDNFIGRLTQRNAPTATWHEFYWQHRLEPQLQLAADRGLLPNDTVNALRRLESRGFKVFMNSLRARRYWP